MKNFLFAIALAVPGLSIAAPDGDWVDISQSSTGDMFAIKASSVRVSGNTAIFWARTQYKQPKSLDFIKVRAKADNLMTKYRAACDTETLSTMAWVYYDTEGNSLSSQNVDYPKAEPVVPESVGEQLLNAACRVVARETKQ